MQWKPTTLNCPTCEEHGDKINAMVAKNNTVWNCFICNKGGKVSNDKSELLLPNGKSVNELETEKTKLTVAGQEYTVVNSAEFIVKNGYNGYKQAKVVNGVKTPSGEAVVVNKDGSWVFANPTFQI